MVEVLKTNFESLFPQIETIIRNGSFIAIDTELTGLVSSQKAKPSLFDTAEERYAKLRSSASDFIICQFGLSVFIKDSKLNKYDAYTYVFYISPQACGSIDRNFTFQTSCMEFLCRYDFDFNKFAYEGIPYLNDVNEKQFEKELSDNSLLISLQHDADNASLQKHYFDVSTWLKSSKVGDEIKIKKDNEIYDYILINYLKFSLKSIWIKILDDEIVIQKVFPEQKKLLEDDNPEKDRLLQSILGFTRLFRVLVDAKKPIIGHNCFLDLLMMYNQFFKPLPKSYEKFKKDMHKMFPLVFDTKHISQGLKKEFEYTGLFNSTVLCEIYSAFRSPKGQFIVLYFPLINHVTGSRYGTNMTPHEAGFDAFICGFVFLRICHLLAISELGENEGKCFTWEEHFEAVKCFKNRINIIRAQCHYVNLQGKDPSARTQLLYIQVKCKKKSIKIGQVAFMMSPYGTVDVKAVSRTSALVAVANYLCAKDILKAFHKNEKFDVTFYNAFHHSKPLRMAMWTGFFLSAGLGAFLVVKTLRSIT